MAKTAAALSLSNTFPSNVIVQILYRTPVESLLRFKCVSKPWYTLISHPKFIRNHFNLSSTCNNHIILKATARSHNYICLLHFTKSLVTVLGISKSKLGDSVSKINFNYFSKDMVVAGSIDGIVCLSHEDEFLGRYVALWNPAIKCWKPIVLRELKIPYDKWEDMSVGFGYDAVADDYKIILLIPVIIPPKFKERCWSRIEIYTVKRDYWKSVFVGQQVCFPFWPKYPSCNFIVDGVPYWVGHGEHPEDTKDFDLYKEEILGAFDPCTGVYKKIPYPTFVKNEGTYVHPVKYMNFVAALVQSPGPCPNSMVDLYVLDKNSSDWTKMHTIGPFSFKKMRIPQCFGTGEIVLKTWEEIGMADRDHIPYYCHPKTNCVSLVSEFNTSVPLWSQSYSYAESLVCVKGMQLVENEDKNNKVQLRNKTWTIWLPNDFESVLHL